MNSAILTGIPVALALGAGIVAITRTFSLTLTRYTDLACDDAVSWKDYPLQRLLDPADLDYLRRRGISETRISQLRAQRRKTFRLCLHSLSRDFDKLHRTLKLLLVHSRYDRPELAALLAKQKVAFCRNVLKAEIALALHACGLDGALRIDLLEPLRAIETELQVFAAAQIQAAAARA